MSTVLAILVGVFLGVCFHKGRICYASAVSDAVFIRSTPTGAGIIVATAVGMIGIGGIYAIEGAAPLWLPGWGLYSFFGGLIFGIGMILAGACLTSTLWRVAAGRSTYAITLGGIFIGALLTDAVLSVIGDWWFTTLWIGPGGTFFALDRQLAPLVGLLGASLLAVGYFVLLDSPGSYHSSEGIHERLSGILRYVGTRSLSLRAAVTEPWDPRIAGFCIGIVVTVWTGLYTIWTVSSPTVQWAGILMTSTGTSTQLLALGDTITLPMIVVIGFLLGSLLSALMTGDFELRPPRKAVIRPTLVGGVLMGIGMRLAPGCNVTNLYSGVISLSVHGLLAGMGILVGGYVATRWLFGPR